MTQPLTSARLRLLLACLPLAACSGPADDAGEGAASPMTTTDGACSDAAACDDERQLPPTGAADAIEAWIAQGYYRQWACEDRPHPARPPSGHSPNRICSNAKASAHGAGEYPTGAASVKELYDATTSRIVGYAVTRKLANGGGDAWYWFERLEGSGVIANGPGSAGPPQRICVRCHNRAGSSTFGHDQVFTQVR